MSGRLFILMGLCCLASVLAAQTGYEQASPPQYPDGARKELQLLSANANRAEQILKTDGATPEAKRLLDAIMPLAGKYPAATEGITAFFMRGYWFHVAHELDSAEHYYKISEQMAVRAGNEKLRLRSITEQATILRLKGHFILASKMNYELLPQLLERKDTALLKRLYMNMCAVFIYLRQLDKTEEYGLELLHIARKTNDRTYMLRAYDNIAAAYKMMGKYAKALEYNRLALHTGGFAARRDEILYNNNISETFIKLEQPDSAMFYLNRNMQMIQFVNSEFLRGLTFVNLGTVYSLKKDYPASVKYFNKADSVFSKSGHEMYHAQALELYAAACHRAGDFQKAEKLLQKVMDIKDSLLSTEVQQRVAEFNTLYKVNEKETQLAVQEAENRLQQKILKKEKRFNFMLVALLVFFLFLLLYSYFSYRKIRNLNKKLEEQKQTIGQQAERLETSNRAKDKLFTIISHDLRSPVGSYQDMAETLGYLLKNKKYDEVEAVTRQIDANGKQLFLLLNSLLAWSLSEQSITDEAEQEILLSEILNPVLSIYKLVAERKSVGFHIDAPEGIRLKCKPGLLSLILRNLLDNAVKHTRPGKAVSVYITRERETVVFRFCNAEENIAPNRLEAIKLLMANPANWNPDNKLIGTGLMLIQQCLIKLNRKIDVYTQNGQLCFELKY